MSHLNFYPLSHLATLLFNVKAHIKYELSSFPKRINILLRIPMFTLVVLQFCYSHSNFHIQQTLQLCHTFENPDRCCSSSLISTFLKTKFRVFHTRSNCRKGKKYLGFCLFICAAFPSSSSYFSAAFL